MEDTSSTAHLVVAWIELEEGNVGLPFDYLRASSETHEAQVRLQECKVVRYAAVLAQGLDPYKELSSRRRGVAVGAAQGRPPSSWAALRQFRPFADLAADGAHVEFGHLSKRENHHSNGKHGESCRELQKVAKVLADRPETPLLYRYARGAVAPH
ncbi:hypothetical protein LX32DRAFT_691405 [Colletotrichum zoysiae]|uniref:Uncharacterized protein n=1 Tax=Colletotrichum zoysiae TaxID=1216348 RepID=A0AAD9HP76_9PEZI|nr:hypothetical protein LX32DRAFT_691405 [Colletotrichum zoysiae]